MDPILMEVCKWLLLWGVPVVLSLIGLGVLVRLGVAMGRRRNGHYGQDIHSALRSLGEGVLYAALPLSFTYNVIFNLPAIELLWIIAILITVVFVMAAGYLIWALITDVVEISFDSEMPGKLEVVKLDPVAQPVMVEHSESLRPSPTRYQE
jgi:hypothetical protein